MYVKCSKRVFIPFTWELVMIIKVFMHNYLIKKTNPTCMVQPASSCRIELMMTINDIVI